MVHACQKKGKCASSEVEKTAKSIKYKDAEDFAKTKHEGLPDKVAKKKKKKKGKHMFKSFKEWVAARDKELQEMSTSTGDVASFKLPIGAGPRLDKKYPDKIALGDDDEEDEDDDMGHDEEDEPDIGLLDDEDEDDEEEHPAGCRCPDCKCKKHGHGPFGH